MIGPMATVIALRRLYGADALHLDDIALHRFIRLDFPEVHQIASLEDVLVKAVKQADSERVSADASSIESGLKSRDARAWVRGKFHSWWFAAVFNAVTRELKSSHTDQNGRAVRCGLQFSPKHFIAVMLPHLEVTHRLSQFFSRRLASATAAGAA
jgi:hypothetical protein